MEKKIVPVSNCADTIMRHGLKPGGDVVVVLKTVYLQSSGVFSRAFSRGKKWQQ